MPARAIRLACLKAIMAQSWPPGTGAAVLIALAEQMAARLIVVRAVEREAA